MHASREIHGIQYLRGVAAVSVVVFHLAWQLQRMAPSNIRLSTLASGVDLFFVISGFIMVYSTAGGTRVSAREFFERRLIRIAPLYWLATAGAVVVLLVVPQFVRQSTLSFAHVLASFAFFPTLHPSASGVYAPLVYVGWTLNYEMLFYALFAAGIALGFGSCARVLAIASAPILILSTIGLVFRPTGLLGFYSNPVMLEFVFGMFLAISLENLAQSKMYTWFSLFGLILLFALPEATEFSRSLRYGLIASAVVGTSALAIWPQMKLMRLVGDASYSIYISHFFVLSAFVQFWKPAFGPPVGWESLIYYYVAGTAFSVLAGILCWRIVEDPITSWCKSVRQRLTKWAVNSAPTVDAS
jgi:exopolysaccharide production protein ExoZ